MKKIILFALSVALHTTVSAQPMVNLDSYAAGQLATKDLNGTARYVGMGGALEALGADLSTMSTNPAGIGMFRRSHASVSFGMNIQGEGKNFQNGTKTNASFDQVGVVISTRLGATSYLNIGFNFHKSRNFDYVLSAANNAVNGSSLHRQTYVKMLRGDLDENSAKNLIHPYRESQLDQLNYRIIDIYQENPTTKKKEYVESISPEAINYMFDRAHTGYIGEYDINLSGNINNRVYLGLTVGIHDVHYKAYSEYSENFKTPTISTSGNRYERPYAKYTDDQEITGTGYDIKIGAIFRPIEESPFRFGVSIATPTWYRLKTRNYTTISDQYGVVDNIKDDVKFALNTPWQFGISAGYTIGTQWALGLSYDFADYGACDMRSITSRYYDSWSDTYNTKTESDSNMKRLTEQTLKGVSTLKAGVEFRADKMLAIRLGYNYVSPMYKSDAVRDQTIDSPGVYMASTSDYTNWKDTHRLTAGVGLTFDKFRVDLAYQYSATNGDFYPYMKELTGTNKDSQGKTFTMTNSAEAVSVKNIRHQLLCTLGYTF